MESNGMLDNFIKSSHSDEASLSYNPKNEYSDNYELLYAKYKNGDLIKIKDIPIYSIVIPTLLSIIGLFQILYPDFSSLAELIQLIICVVASTIMISILSYYQSLGAVDQYIHANTMIENYMLAFEQKNSKQ